LLEALGEELLVEAGWWGLVGHGCPGAWAASERQGWEQVVPMLCESA
jgi:hypothetical protein